LPALFADAEVERFTRIPVPAPPGFARTWLEAAQAGRDAGRSEVFAIVDGDDGSFLGCAGAPAINGGARTVELGYMVAPGARGRGVATEALRLLTGWAFTTAGALRAELVISVENEVSKRVAERCGYVREAVLRSVHQKHGIRQDVEIWSRLATDA
jgi:RimJ/RimL family protein N-acetyltransferase